LGVLFGFATLDFVAFFLGEGFGVALRAVPVFAAVVFRGDRFGAAFFELAVFGLVDRAVFDVPAVFFAAFADDAEATFLFAISMAPQFKVPFGCCDSLPDGTWSGIVATGGKMLICLPSTTELGETWQSAVRIPEKRNENQRTAQTDRRFDCHGGSPVPNPQVRALEQVFLSFVKMSFLGPNHLELETLSPVIQ
jgi:hypothetical protein